MRPYLTGETEVHGPTSTEPVAPASLFGLRIALAFMAAFSIFCGYWGREAIPGLEYLGHPSPPMDEMHQTAVLVVYAFALPLPIYLLAAIHVGLTRRGVLYMTLSVAALVLQVVLGLVAQPFLGSSRCCQ